MRIGRHFRGEVLRAADINAPHASTLDFCRRMMTLPGRRMTAPYK